MDNDEKIKYNLKQNERFIKAFEWLRERQNLMQYQLAEALGFSSPQISAYKNGKKLVSKEQKSNFIIRVRDLFKLEINLYYLDGISDYMLVENVPEGQEYETYQKSVNPDYEQIKKDSMITGIDQSSLVNATIAAKDETINALKREIEAKDKLIKSLLQQNEDLRKQIYELKHTNLDSYPFPTGVSDHHDKDIPHV